MNKIGIITIVDNNNYGNRLQNYALQEILKLNNFNVETLKNVVILNSNDRILYRKLRFLINKITQYKNKFTKRYKKFSDFNQYIDFAIKMCTAKSNIADQYNYFITGSDQVWNPNFGRLTNIDLLNFANNNQKIAFSASFGISELPEDKKEYAKQNLQTFKAISVREDAGKKIVEDLTGRTDVEVLIDPTMLLAAEEWDKVSKKPEQLKCEKYILNYFLGELPEEWEIEINRIAKENNCEIINILDKSSPFYQTGPSEFLYLEKNAFLICTDSFHSSVFSIIYDTPFIVFDRKQNGVVSMNSRIDTLLTKFGLQNRRFKGKISEDLLKSNYTEAKKILEEEKQKSFNFLKKALDIE